MSGEISEVFVNRDDELLVLEQFRGAVVAGNGGMLLLHGDGGIGKSALIGKFVHLTEAAESTVRVVLTRCRALVGPGDAYGPILNALAAIVKPKRRRVAHISKAVAIGAPDLLALVPAIGPVLKFAGEAALAAIEKGSGVSDSLAPFQQSIVRSVSESLLDTAKEQHPIIVVIDDAQQIDSSTLQVLDHLVDQLPDRYIGIVLVARREELTESTELGRVVDDWRRRRLLLDIPLRGLPRNEIEELADITLAGTSVAGNAVDITSLTGGNPLCLTQYLRLVRETGRWEADSSSLIRDSSDIREAVETIARGRLKLLDDTTIRLMVIGATEGETFHTAVVEQVADLPGEEVRERLHTASISTGLIVLDEDNLWEDAAPSDSYTFEHSLLHAALYTLQSPATRRDRHAKIAEWLVSLVRERASASTEMLLDVAHHYRSAGVYGKSAEFTLQTVHELVANRLSFDEAKDLAQAAINDLYQMSATGPDRDRRLAKAIELFLALTELHWRSNGAADDRFSLEALARDAQRASERVGDPMLLARSVLLRGKVTLHTRGLGDSLVLLRQAVELARATDDPETLFIALAEYGRQLPKQDLLAGIQVLRDAEALFDRTLLLRASTDPVVVHAHNLTEMQLGVNLFDGGNLGAAIDRLTDCIARLRTARLNLELPIALNYFAQLMIACGQWDTATATLEDALSIEEQHGSSGWHAYNTALLALVKTRTANRDECRIMAEAAWEETKQTRLANLVPIVRNLYAQILLNLADADPRWLADSDRLAAETVQETQNTRMVRSEIAALILRAQIARYRDDKHAAAAFADRAISILDAYGDLPALRTEEVLFQAALAHRSIADHSRAKELLGRAMAEVERKVQSLPGSFQSAFLTDVPLNLSIAELFREYLPQPGQEVSQSE